MYAIETAEGSDGSRPLLRLPMKGEYSVSVSPTLLMGLPLKREQILISQVLALDLTSQHGRRDLKNDPRRQDCVATG